MTTLKVNATVVGGPNRPYYTGYVIVHTDDCDPDTIKRKVFRKLKSTSFPEIGYASLRINKVELI